MVAFLCAVVLVVVCWTFLQTTMSHAANEPINGELSTSSLLPESESIVSVSETHVRLTDPTGSHTELAWSELEQVQI